MTKRWDQVRPEVAQRLMAAVDAHIDRCGTSGMWEGPTKTELLSCLQMARAEAAPKLRTRAEVDAEIVAALRDSVDEGPSYDCLNDNGNSVTLKLRKLCAEPIAPEAEQPPLCPDCERPMSRYGGADESGWTCIVCNAAGDADRDHPEAVEACSCEEALALRKKLEAVNALLLSLRQRSHAFSRGTVTRDVLERLFMELSECLK